MSREDDQTEATVKRTGLMLLLFLGLGIALAPGGARGDGAWLDAPLITWNAVGMAVPAAPPIDPLAFTDPRCTRTERPPETAEDAAVVAAGWILFNTYQAGWGVKLISGLTGHDGMCRPLGYQMFVFVDGAFAGTISPLLMDARTDGAANTVFLQPPGDGLTATFARYAPTDPLCCPSATSSVLYHIERTDGGSVLLPVVATTTPTGP